MFNETNLARATVTCHPYRTARVFGARIAINRNSIEAEKIEELLAKKAGVSRDNHVVYTITEEGAPPLHVWCTDSTMKFGTELLEESW